jgi:hypothetical protein
LRDQSKPTKRMTQRMTIGPNDQEIPDSVLARSLRKSAGFSVTAHAFTNSITNGSLYEKNGGGEETGPQK